MPDGPCLVRSLGSAHRAFGFEKIQTAQEDPLRLRTHGGVCSPMPGALLVDAAVRIYWGSCREASRREWIPQHKIPPCYIVATENEKWYYDWYGAIPHNFLQDWLDRDTHHSCRCSTTRLECRQRWGAGVVALITHEFHLELQVGSVVSNSSKHWRRSSPWPIHRPKRHVYYPHT